MAASCVTVEHCKSWEKSGKQEFIRYCNGVGDKTVLASLGSHDFRQAVYDVCLHVVRGNLKQEQAIHAFADLKENYPDFVSLVLDVLGLLDVELNCVDEVKGARDRYYSLVQTFALSFECEALSKSRLDHDTLENAGLVPNKTVFTQKHVKIKTRLYYKQQKFNLLREESEGYSKLVTELNQEITEKLTPEVVLQNIKSLIGCFNLDPNRVIDILLESFENRPELEDFYVPLIQSYVKDNITLCHCLGFKFQFFKDDETPMSLFKLAALLMKNELVQLDTLYPHLYPPDSTILEHSKKEMNDAKQYARKLMVVNLSDKANEDKKKDEDTIKIDPHKNNQKLGLVEALLNIGAWEKSKSILDRLPEFFGTTYKPVAAALCALIHTVMDPVYRKNSGMSTKIVAKWVKPGKLGSEVQLATTFKEVYTLVYPMVTYLGPYAACDPVLLAKLIRLGKFYMNKRNHGVLSVEDNIMYFGLLSILDEVVIPSLSFLTCNCCISEELWTLVKLFPYELRYRMYGNWKNEMYNIHPSLIKVKADCLEKAKYIMKRLSKENVKQSGRQLGKLSHSNPGVLFEYVIRQIEKYDNLIGPVVDSLKYLTNLSYDILVFCVIEAVGNPEKEKMKIDETSLSTWLQSLANFAGSICKKYQVDLAGMMQYVTNQLKAGKSIDLLLMREIVQKMSGIEISEEITMDQLEAMSGGELLRQEGGYFTQVRNTKKSSNRLKDTVLEHDLALALCLLISQHRDAVIYKEGSARHLKHFGKLYDQCQDTLVQFGSFLSMQLSTEEFVKKLPPIEKMVSEFHVPPDAAFFLSRPLYSYDVNTKFDELRKAEKGDKDKKVSSTTKTQKYIEASEIVMEPVVENIRPLQTPKIWEDLSPTFYVTFWSLSMYDIHVPTSAYEKQVQQLQAQAQSAEENKDMNQSKRKKEKERCNQLIEKLKDEEKKQTEHVQRVMARLKNQKEAWFVSKSTKNETITQFLQLCVFPRSCFTASDAIYCAEFIHILHSLKTPNFSTLICYDRIFCDISYTVTSCTENEAHRYGRFLCAALDTVMRWHGNKQCYDKECGAYPGFVTVFRKGENSNSKADQLDFENYRHVCHKWHFRMTKSMVACIESGKYIQIRNALIVLTKILPHYPRIIQFGSPLERRIDRLKQEEKDKRPDLFALAMGYSGQLKSRKGTWVNDIEFHLRDKEKKAGAAASGASSTSQGSSSGPSGDNSGPKGDNASSGKEKTKMVNGEKSGVTKEKEQKKVKSEKGEKTVEKSRSEEKLKTASSTEAKKSASDIDRKDGSGNASSSKEKKERLSSEKEKSRSSEEKPEKSKEDKAARKQEKADKSREDKGQSSTPYIKEEKVDKSERIKEEKKEKVKERKEDKSGKDGHARTKDGKEEIKSKEEKIKSKLERAKEEAKEKRDKESRKEEKHERIKLKRSFSPEESTRDSHRDDRDWEAGSATSNSSSHRSHFHTPEASPRHDERDLKRRKTEPSASSSKEDTSVTSKSRHRRSLSPEKEEKRERKEKKRDHYSDHDVGASSSKKRRSLEPSSSRSSSKLNGDSEDRGRSKDDSYDRHHDGSRAGSSRKDLRDGEHERSRSKDREKKKDKDRSKRPKKS
ncbi:THO complex subunit 2-like isoform X2 [Ruditapes philippinarum]|uniref:THO complex subunit 2-like isoform X2 n=1 Tax=Ruditapes philippinarum TaxID=129788 RepID=UPI00295AB544|nr:THO complex subunit 2-like isoform X2 [Ruditapes philippinarum]